MTVGLVSRAEGIKKKKALLFQNKARKTNKSLKLDFPKHNILSY